MYRGSAVAHKRATHRALPLPEPFAYSPYATASRSSIRPSPVKRQMPM